MLLHLRKWSQYEQVIICGDALAGDIDYATSPQYLSDVSKLSLAQIRFQRPTEAFMTGDAAI